VRGGSVGGGAVAVELFPPATSSRSSPPSRRARVSWRGAGPRGGAARGAAEQQEGGAREALLPAVDADADANGSDPRGSGNGYTGVSGGGGGGGGYNSRRNSSLLPPSPTAAAPSAAAAAPRQRMEVRFERLGLVLKGSRRVVLADVSGTLRPGTLTGVMGPSGCGKTSFLNSLLGRATYGDRTGWGGAT